MSEPSRTSAGHSIADLKDLVKHDLEASNELQSRLEQLRQDIKDGKKLPKKKIDLMEVSNKDMTKDLVARIEQIEASSTTATDREMLQALNARLAVCDVQAMRLAELRELEREARGDQHDFLEPEEAPQLHKAVSAADSSSSLRPEHIEDISKVKHEELENEPESESASFVRGPSNQAYYSDEDEYGRYPHDQNDEAESEPDMSSWSAPYRVLGIHPDTSDEEMEGRVKKSMAGLASRHDPRRLPNDAEAPERWAVIEKAREVLTDVEKRRYLDRHQKVPAGLEELDLAKLNLE